VRESGALSCSGHGHGEDRASGERRNEKGDWGSKREGESKEAWE
jgi:hypothetical protein